MPTYEFRCPFCKNEHEFFSHKIVHEKTMVCPKCGKTMEKEIFACTVWKIKDDRHGMYINRKGFHNEKDDHHFNNKFRTTAMKKKKAKELAKVKKLPC